MGWFEDIFAGPRNRTSEQQNRVNFASPGAFNLAVNTASDVVANPQRSSVNLAPQIRQAGGTVSNFLNRANSNTLAPDTRAAIDASLALGRRQLEEEILPGLNQEFLGAGAGAFGDSRFDLARRSALSDYSRNAGETAALLGMQQLNNDRTQGIAAAGMLPGLVNASRGNNLGGLDAAQILANMAATPTGSSAQGTSTEEGNMAQGLIGAALVANSLLGGGGGSGVGGGTGAVGGLLGLGRDALEWLGLIDPQTVIDNGGDLLGGMGSWFANGGDANWLNGLDIGADGALDTVVDNAAGGGFELPPLPGAGTALSSLFGGGGAAAAETGAAGAAAGGALPSYAIQPTTLANVNLTGGAAGAATPTGPLGSLGWSGLAGMALPAGLFAAASLGSSAERGEANALADSITAQIESARPGSVVNVDIGGQRFQLLAGSRHDNRHGRWFRMADGRWVGIGADGSNTPIVSDAPPDVSSTAAAPSYVDTRTNRLVTGPELTPWQRGLPGAVFGGGGGGDR